MQLQRTSIHYSSVSLSQKNTFITFNYVLYYPLQNGKCFVFSLDYKNLEKNGDVAKRKH